MSTSTRRHRAVPSLLLTVTALAGLAACGDDGDEAARDSGSSEESSFADLPPEQIVSVAKDAVLDARALHLTRELTEDGVRTFTQVHLDDQGNCLGRLDREGGSAALLGVEGSTWFRPDPGFWEAAAGDRADEIVDVVGDRWVPGEFERLCDLSALFSDSDDSSDSGRELESLGTEDLDGEEVVTVRTTFDDGSTSVAYVLTAAPHHLVRLDVEGPSAGVIELDGFGSPVAVQAPDLDEIVSLDELEGVVPDVS